ncbi:hypothetical protein ACX9MO_13855 [Pseudooceanicola sp. 502str34]
MTSASSPSPKASASAGPKRDPADGRQQEQRHEDLRPDHRPAHRQAQVQQRHHGQEAPAPQRRGEIKVRHQPHVHPQQDVREVQHVAFVQRHVETAAQPQKNRLQQDICE